MKTDNEQLTPLSRVARLLGKRGGLKSKKVTNYDELSRLGVEARRRNAEKRRLEREKAKATA